MTRGHQLRAKLVPWQRWGIVCGLVGAAVCSIEAFLAPHRFLPAYLVAWLFCWSLSAGALALALIHHLTGGAWGMAIRRILEAAYELMPLLAIGFVPILLNVPTLYVWAQHDASDAHAGLAAKRWYLNESAFLIRAAVYLAVWSLLGFVVNRLTVPSKGDARWQLRLLGLISGPGLIAWGLAETFASIDWIMSLEPHWSSTTFGVLIAAGQGVAAMALAICAVVILHQIEPFASLASADVLNDLGNFLLAFVMLWTYLSFTQFLIIWSGNLPEESPWYLRRAGGGWQWIAALLALFHFAVPFLLLLSRQMKRQPWPLAAIALLLLVMRLVEIHWLVQPAFQSSVLPRSWSVVAAPLAIGGFWLAAFVWRLRVRAALPIIAEGATA